MENEENICVIIDELGRVLIPKKIRNQLCLSEKNKLKITIEKNKIILEKLS